MAGDPACVQQCYARNQVRLQDEAAPWASAGDPSFQNTSLAALQTRFAYRLPLALCPRDGTVKHAPIVGEPADAVGHDRTWNRGGALASGVLAKRTFGVRQIRSMVSRANGL